MDSQVPTTLITNVRVFVDGELRDGAVEFSDGVITKVVPGFKFQVSSGTDGEVLPETWNLKPETIIDGHGAMLLPGAIDVHVHFREPGLTEKADIATESLAAAAGGVTTVFDMPNVKPTTTTREALEEKHRLFREKCVVNYGLFFGITNDNIDEALKIPQDEIVGYKVFLGSSTGGMLMNDAEKLRHLFSSTKRVIAVHSESEDIIRANRERLANGAEDLPVEMHPLIRSREACLETTRMAVDLAIETGANLHICHITTADELEYINGFKFQVSSFKSPETNTPETRNLKLETISTEACVAHLWFTDADYARLGTKIKCNPAIKTAADREALRRGLSDGSIDIIATDHAPHLLKDKEGGALKAASGMPSVQFSYLAMLELVHQGVVSLETVIKLMCENPAKRFGLENRGKIAVGYAADLVLVQSDECRVQSGAPKNNYELCTNNYALSKCGWSPFEGETFHHQIKTTWVNGRCAFDRP